MVLRSPSFAITADSTLSVYRAVLGSNYAPVVAAFALHVSPNLPSGTIWTRGGPLMASADVLERTDARTEVVGLDEVQFFDAGIVDQSDRRSR